MLAIIVELLIKAPITDGSFGNFNLERKSLELFI